MTMTKTITHLQTKDGYSLNIGTKIYYTGDMANHDGNFIIVGIVNDRWGTHLKLNEIDGDRSFYIELPSLEAGAGRRFIPQELREKERKEYMERMKAHIN